MLEKREIRCKCWAPNKYLLKKYTDKGTIIDKFEENPRFWYRLGLEPLYIPGSYLIYLYEGDDIPPHNEYEELTEFRLKLDDY